MRTVTLGEGNEIIELYSDLPKTLPAATPAFSDWWDSGATSSTPITLAPNAWTMIPLLDQTRNPGMAASGAVVLPNGTWNITCKLKISANIADGKTLGVGIAVNKSTVAYSSDCLLYGVIREALMVNVSGEIMFEGSQPLRIFVYSTNTANINITLCNVVCTCTSQSLPAVVVNGSSLISGTAPGEVVIDPVSKVGSLIDYNRSIDGSYYITRPDMWPMSTVINFPDNVYGMRFAGTYNTGAANTWVYWSIGDDSIIPPTSHVIQYGGHMGGCYNFSFSQFPVNAQTASLSSSAVNLTNFIALKYVSLRLLYMQHIDAYQAIDTTYNVWFIAKRSGTL
jgi:hypothetical protein